MNYIAKAFKSLKELHEEYEKDEMNGALDPNYPIGKNLLATLSMIAGVAYYITSSNEQIGKSKQDSNMEITSYEAHVFKHTMDMLGFGDHFEKTMQVLEYIKNAQPTEAELEKFIVDNNLEMHPVMSYVLNISIDVIK